MLLFGDVCFEQSTCIYARSVLTEVNSQRKSISETSQKRHELSLLYLAVIKSQRQGGTWEPGFGVRPDFEAKLCHL